VEYSVKCIFWVAARKAGKARKALTNPNVREILCESYFDVRSIGGADGDRFVRAEAEKWGRFIRDNYIMVE